MMTSSWTSCSASQPSTAKWKRSIQAFSRGLDDRVIGRDADNRRPRPANIRSRRHSGPSFPRKASRRLSGPLILRRVAFTREECRQGAGKLGHDMFAHRMPRGMAAGCARRCRRPASRAPEARSPWRRPKRPPFVRQAKRRARSRFARPSRRALWRVSASNSAAATARPSSRRWPALPRACARALARPWGRGRAHAGSRRGTARRPLSLVALAELDEILSDRDDRQHPLSLVHPLLEDGGGLVFIELHDLLEPFSGASVSPCW